MTSTEPPVTQHTPFTAEETGEIVAKFHRDGFYNLGQVLIDDEVAALKDAMDRKLVDPAMTEADERGDHRRGLSLMRMFEYDRSFRALMEREPIVSLAEAILGADCHVISQNALCNGPGEGVTGWHVDDRVFFQLPDDMPAHDPRIRVPCFVMNVMAPLTATDELKFGPTQVVPGSHYSGRQPNTQDEPIFAGCGPHTIFAKPGDVYMFHNQVWHRGAPNTSDRVRYVAGVTYGQRAIAQRFYPFIDYRMPDHVWEGADDRLQRLLGRHGKGAYG